MSRSMAVRSRRAPDAQAACSARWRRLPSVPRPRAPPHEGRAARRAPRRPDGGPGAPCLRATWSGPGRRLIAECSERPRHLLANLRPRAIRQGVGQWRHGAGIAERAERPRRVPARRPDGRMERASTGVTLREPMATSAAAACAPGVVSSPSRPPQLRSVSQTSSLTGVASSISATSGVDRLGGAIAELAKIAGGPGPRYGIAGAQTRRRARARRAPARATGSASAARTIR